MDIDAFENPASGSWFDDQVVGRKASSATRTITEYEIGAFAGLTGDYCELHTSETFASESEFGGRIAHGMLNLVIAHGLMVRSGYFERTGLALLGWDKVRMTAVVKIGDTVQARWELVGLRESRSRPGAGIVRDRVRLVNQHGTTVLEGEVSTLVSRRPEN